MTFNEASVIEALKNDESIQRKSEEISKDLVESKYDISSLVESLAVALTSTSMDMRANGMKLLSNTLLNLPIAYLTEKQLGFIVLFYSDRLKDHHSVIPAIIDGIRALVSMKNCPKPTVVMLITNFFQHTACQSQVRNDREKIYHIIKTISEKFVDELIAIKPDFVYSVLKAIDCERDPRNLSFLFEFMPDFVKKFPPDHLSDELFETFACYFPIDFHPTKNDPASISREQLANKLANCLVCTEEFIESTIELCLEKLESDLVVAKLDSLELLSRSAKNFQIKNIEGYFDKIWTALKSEIYPGSDNKNIVSSGYSVLNDFLEAASYYPEISKNLQTHVLSDILNDLSDLNHRLFMPATTVALVCVNADCVFAADKVLNSFTLKLSSAECATEDRCKIFNVIADVLKICSLKNSISKLNPTILQQVQEELLTFISSNNKCADSMKVALKCTSVAVTIFSIHNRILLYKLFCNILTQNNIKVDIKEVLYEFGHNFPEEMETYAINPLLDIFPNTDTNTKAYIYLNISVLIPLEQFERTVLHLMISKMFDVKDMNAQIVALKAVRRYLDTDANTVIATKLYNYYNIISRIVEFLKKEDLPKDILQQFSIILSLVIRKLSIKEQEEIFANHFPEISFITQSELSILNGILSFMNHKADISEHLEKLLKSLIDLSLNNSNDIIRSISNQLLCTLFNKVIKDSAEFLNSQLERVEKEVDNCSTFAVQLLSWITKGLIVRGSPKADKLVEKIADLLDHPKLSLMALDDFQIISKEFSDIDLPNVKLLYKQKLFNVVLKKLEPKLKDCFEVHINAFAYILEITPLRVLQMEMEKVGLLIFKCLKIENCNTIRIALEIHKHFFEQQNDYFRRHLNHLIKELLDLTQYRKSMQIRILSIECLAIICTYPIYVTQPYKLDVSFGLIPALDDKKRLVRNAAVKTRNAWFLLDGNNFSE